MNGKHLWLLAVVVALSAMLLSAIWQQAYQSGYADGLQNWSMKEMHIDD